MDEAPWAAPPLPRADPRDGELKWERWEAAPSGLSHVPDGCFTCGTAKPLLMAHGKTWYDPLLTVRLSRGTGGRASRWGQRPVREPRWVRTHVAFLCARCVELRVFRKADRDEIHYSGPRGADQRTRARPRRVQLPQDDALF